MKRCPYCGNNRFYVTAHVTQDWIVDENENFVECTNECGEVVHRPDNDDLWTCTECGYTSDGETFEVKPTSQPSQASQSHENKS